MEMSNATNSLMPITEESHLIWALKTAYLVVTKYAWMSAVIIGIPGNIISILITSKRTNRHISSCNYMTALAMADLMTLVSVVWALLLMHWGFADNIHPRELLYQIIWYVIYTFAILSGLFLAEMSVDRLIAVRYPMVAVRFCTRSRAWKTVTATFFLVALLNANLFYTYRYMKDPKIGSDILRASVPDNLVIETLALAFQLGFGTLIPFLIIVVSNLLIILTVRRANKERQKMEMIEAKGQKKRDKEAKYLTRMLILVCIAYVACSIPYRMYDVIMNLPELLTLYDMTDLYWILRYGVQYWIIITVWYMNYAVNFYLYLIGGGRKYRNDVRAVFRDMFHECKRMSRAEAAVATRKSNIRA